MKLSTTMSRPLLALALAIGGVACSGDDEPEGGDGAGTTVDAAMRDWEILLDPTTVPAGAITFDVTNDGPTTHEFEIFSGDADPASLPVENGVANTEGLELIDEVEDVTPGATAELSVDLEPGTYALICNLADHYEEGMFTSLEVE